MFWYKYKKLFEDKEIDLSYTLNKLNETETKLNDSLEKLQVYESEFKDIIDKNKLLEEKNTLVETTEKKLQQLNETYQQGVELHKKLKEEIALYEETLEINTFGLYKPQFLYENSEKFKYELEMNYARQKELIRLDKAAICNTEWSVGGSKVEGRKMTNQYKKLMLYAFNGECDSLISKVKWNNANKTKDRITKAFENINTLGETQNVHITLEYLDLKRQELFLTHEYEQKKYEEKEEQRLIREQMREEEKAQREMEKAQREAEDEERRFQKALEKAKNELQGSNTSNEVLNEQIKELEKKLLEAQEKKERAIAQAQLTKIGHIYVISNVGSFGEDIYKIGMTRRLDPLDRVKELGDASVPFHFDIHAIIYSQNAPQLEYEIHKKFSERRINRVNQRKEFFKVSLEEIELFIKEHTNAEIEFTKLAEAKEYRETLSMLEQVNKIINEAEEVSNFPKSLM